MEHQLKFRAIHTSQRKSQTINEFSERKLQPESLKNMSRYDLLNSPTYSNISYRKSHKHKASQQGNFYASPLLAQDQLLTIDKMKHLQKTDFFGQLKSFDPYQYPTRLSEIHLSPISNRQENKISSVEVIIPPTVKDSNLIKLANNLSRHKSRDKLHRGIPQKHDIKSLAIWVDLMVQQINNKFGNSKNLEYYEEVQNILTLCLKELIRQISIDCIERSVLLENIWTQYMEINRSVVDQMIESKKEQETNDLKQLRKTHQLYQEEIDNFKIMIKDLKDQQTTLTERCLRLKENGKYLKKTNRNLQNIIRELRFQLNDVTTNNKFLVNEIENLKEYIEDAKKDIISFQNQLMNQQQVSQKEISDTSFQSTSRKPILQRAGTLTVSSFQSQLKEFKILRPGRVKTFFKEPKQEEKLKKILKNDSDSDNNSDIELLLYAKDTDTYDLAQIMGTQSNQTTQTPPQVTEIHQKYRLLPDTRQEIIQTDLSMNNCQHKETQTEILAEIAEAIRSEEEQLIQIQDKLIQASTNYGQIKIESEDDTPKSRRISEFFQTLGEASNKMKQTMHLQREFRTSLMLTNSAQKDDNQQKQNQIIQLKTKNDDLLRNVEDITNEVNELETQLEMQERINQKLQKKYLKIKEKKQSLLEKTQNLVSQFTKTQKFTNIMKKKIQEKRQSQLQQNTEQSSQTNRNNNNNSNNNNNNLSHNNQQQVNSAPKLPSIATISPVKNKQVEDNTSQKDDSFINQLSGRQSNDDNMKIKKWNIHITNADEHNDNESDISQQIIQSQNNSIKDLTQFDAVNTSQMSNQSNHSRKSANLTVKQQQKKQQNQFQLIPNNSNKQVPKSAQRRKVINPQPSVQNSESMRFISQTLQQFLNEELDNSDTSSETSSFSYRLEELKKRKLDNNLHRKNATLAQGPKFQNRNTNVESTSQLNYQRSQFLINQLSEKLARNPKAGTAKMQKINVLKFISQFYSEKIRQYQNKNMPLHQICYEYFVNTYGFKTMAEQKLTNFYQSLFAYREANFRISLFARFIELFNPLTLDDLENYIQSLKYLDENETAIHLAQVINEKGVLIPLEKAIQSFDSLHSCLPVEVKEKISKEIRYNTMDRKGKLCIDLDFFIGKVLTGYHQLKMMHQAHFEEVFYSADMDMDGMIEYQEFQKLYLHFEINQGTKTNEKQIRSQFMERCDTISAESGEKAMSFDRFATFSLENNIFTEDKFQKFAQNVDQSDPIKSLHDLKENWSQIQILLSNRIESSKSDASSYYRSIIQKLDTALSNIELKQSYWISYRILDVDTKAVYLNQMVKELMINEYNEIQELMNDIFDDNYGND